MNIPQVTVGPEKVSVTITRKTEGDLLVAQFSSERWFERERDAADAVNHVLRVFSAPRRPRDNGEKPDGEVGKRRAYP